MAIKALFLGGLLVTVMAPLWRRSRKIASAMLAVGALAVLACAMFDLIYPDVRLGQAAIAANRRFELMTVTCEASVLALALLSLMRPQKMSFWLGWVINLGYGVWLTVILIWLQFFWHW